MSGSKFKRGPLRGAINRTRFVIIVNALDNHRFDTVSWPHIPKSARRRHLLDIPRLPVPSQAKRRKGAEKPRIGTACLLSVFDFLRRWIVRHGKRIPTINEQWYRGKKWRRKRKKIEHTIKMCSSLYTILPDVFVGRRRFIVERPGTPDSTNRTNDINSRYVDTTESIPFWNTIFTRRFVAVEIRYNVGIVYPPARLPVLFREERANNRRVWPLLCYATHVEIVRVYCGSWWRLLKITKETNELRVYG